MEKIHQFSQDIFVRGGGSSSKGGVCYYMCNYVEKYIWSNVKDYSDAKQAAYNFKNYRALMNHAIVKNHDWGQDAFYNTAVTTFEKETLYRVEVGLDSTRPNHEIIMIMNENEFTFFEPNGGFFCERGNCAQNLVDALNSLYNKAIVKYAAFKRVRKINQNSPKGYPEE